MVEEDYVSFEIAKLLKEKGFNEKCNSFYRKTLVNNKLIDKEELYLAGRLFLTNSELQEKSYKQVVYCTAPTLQMAMKWLREIYKLEVRSTYDYDKDSWWGNINPMFEETDENSNIYQKALRFDYQGKSYEKVCETAIKYCLENF